MTQNCPQPRKNQPRDKNCRAASLAGDRLSKKFLDLADVNTGEHRMREGGIASTTLMIAKACA
jgi:hypothetical protein